MLRVRGRVQSGRLVVDEPTELPDGSEIDLIEVDDAEADAQAWSPELDVELERRHRAVQGGEFVTSEQFLAKLRARRTA